MDEYDSLSHSRWECQYQVVFIPKCRRQTVYEQLRQHLGELFHKLARQRDSQILEGHLMADHVHRLIAIPRNMRRRRWWGTSRERARSIWRGCTVRRGATALASTSGRGATSFRQLDETSRGSAITSATKSKRTSDWSR
jgi:REP element-mobilizing transposase RayT